MKVSLIIFVFLIENSIKCAIAKPKNIVLIMADDLGYNDVSYHGSNEIPTPNIDALAYNGIIMDRFYALPLCTPSRASLMTGKWPFKTGMHHSVIGFDEPWGLSLDEKILPQYLKDAGYATHLIGKWHLGFFEQAYTPTERGYDSHYGYLGGAIDYFDHTQQIVNRSRGLDFRRNHEVASCEYGQYATDLFTFEAINIINQHDPSKPLFLQINHLAPHDPIGAKKEDLQKFSYITDINRRTYAAMVSSMDQSVGDVVEALSASGLLDDTIIVFYSDNGGATRSLPRTNTGSNYPMRGMKRLAWEGGIRVPGIIYSPGFSSGVIRKQYMHVIDLLPTLISLSGASVQINGTLDGIDLSNMILNETGTFRKDIVTIDDVDGISSLISDRYKLVNGTFPLLNNDGETWTGTNNNSQYNNDQYVPSVQNSKVAQALSKYNGPLSSSTITSLRTSVIIKCVGFKKTCNVTQAPCLFDILSDPCEEINLASSLPDIYSSMKSLFQQYLSTVVPTRFKDPDPASDPSNFNRIWTWWE